MNKNLLRIIHGSVLKRSIQFEYNKIPTKLNSLYINNPSQSQIFDDYRILRQHFNHPIFIDFIPTYYELQENPYKAWLNKS